MVRGLTDIAIKHLRAGQVRREIPDRAARGLYLIIEPSGFKSFATRCRINGKPAKISHGNVPLSVARKLHADVLHEIKEGRDPRVAKQQARTKRRAIEADTFAAIVERYFQIVCGLKRDGDKLTFNDNHRTAGRRLADLERLVLPILGNRPITLIKRSEVVALLDKIQLDNGPVMADRTLGSCGAYSIGTQRGQTTTAAHSSRVWRGPKSVRGNVGAFSPTMRFARSGIRMPKDRSRRLSSFCC